MEEDFNSLSGRVEWLQKKSGMTKREFALEMNIDPANFNRKVKGVQVWTEKDFQKFAERGVNVEWLKTGEGEPYEPIEEINAAKNVETRPRMTVYANAGQLTEEIGAYKERMPVVAQFPKYDYTIVVHGDSMEPMFSSGEEVACRDVTKSSFLQWGQPHVLNTSQGVVLKRIYQGDGTIICRSENKLYPEFEIPMCDIYTIGLVVGKLHIY